MTDEIRRAQRARAQRDASTPPDTVTFPATLRQLLDGWPLYWNHPGADLLAWSRSLRRDGLPRGLRDALAALDEGTVTAPSPPRWQRRSPRPPPTPGSRRRCARTAGSMPRAAG